MTATQFDALSYEEKLRIVEPDAPKLAQFLTWSGTQRHITVYAVENFYAELIFNVTERRLEAIIPFDTVDYLEKYRGFMSKLDGQIRGLINDPNPFDNL
ncbi:hypothetical protein [Gelidibacter japonicus]|uniref:hypothetical protein n=1 Tax=Gelidibacter japonicus TaxID=1962232 RepID=UPI003A92CDB9